MKNIWRNLLLIILLVILIFVVWIITDKKTLSKEEIIENIEIIENSNNSNAVLPDIFEDSIGTDVFGEKDYYDSFEVNQMGVSVLKSGTSIMLIPAPDFLDTQVFHYYDDGTLALYVSVSNTIGGEIKYYFYKDKIIDITQTIEEDINIRFKNELELLNRAKLVYDRYMK